MKLTEFALDMPYVAREEVLAEIMKVRSVSHEEAVFYDYQTDWKGKRKEFAAQSRCICSFFERLFVPVQTAGCRKIIVECVAKQEYASCRKALGVCITQVVFDFSRYAAADKQGKKKMLLAALQDGVLAVCRQEGIDEGGVRAAVQGITDRRYLNAWVWKTLKIEGNEVAVRLEHDIDRIDFYFAVSRDNRVVKESFFKSCKPDEWDYAFYLGKLVKKENQAVLLDREGCEVGRIGV